MNPKNFPRVSFDDTTAWLTAWLCVLLVVAGSYVVHAQTVQSVLEREPHRVRSDDMRILRGQELKKHWRRSFQKAEERIWITTFSTSDPTEVGIFTRVMKPLENAVKRGVNVRIVMPEALERNRKLAPHFEERGIEVHLHDGSTIMHSKIVVVDDSQVYGGSANFSFAALAREAETMIWMENDSLNQKLSDYISNQLLSR